MISTSDIVDYLKEHGTTAESSLANKFCTTEAVIGMMMERLEEKGRVKSVVVKGTCGCACGCGGKDKRSWRYVGK